VRNSSAVCWRPATSARKFFRLTGKSQILISEDSDELKRTGQYLADLLSLSTGFDIVVSSLEGDIKLMIIDNSDLGAEGYEMIISEDQIVLKAPYPAGIFYAIQTIRQLLPAKIELSDEQTGPWEIATGTIRDYPRYSYRGSLLDVSRHFFGVEDVKRYLDFLAFYKMNVLHLHLTDDQGWRIEIKSWPNLTAYGGSTEVGGGEGGFYTQEDYKEIVEYAADRFITIVPEIDMPGHSHAAMASYPELNCDGNSPELYTGTDYGFSSFCTGREITYQFIDDVIREIAALTPEPYIHIGGDESHVTQMEDYLLFIDKVQRIVNKYDKQMIGWDEIAQANLSNTSVVQLWNNADFAMEAIRKGSKIIVSPATKTYLDMKYDSTTRLGLDWAGYIEVDDGYNWDPASFIDGLTDDDILGVEAPLWSETVTNMDEIEYMAFPRLPGYAEIGWTSSELRDWNEYKQRLGKHAARFKAMQIDFYRSELVPWVDGL